MKIHPSTKKHHAWIEFDAEDHAEIQATALRMQREMSSTDHLLLDQITACYAGGCPSCGDFLRDLQ